MSPLQVSQLDEIQLKSPRCPSPPNMPHLEGIQLRTPKLRPKVPQLEGIQVT